MRRMGEPYNNTHTKFLPLISLCRFILVRGLFSQDEMVKITDCVEKSEDIKKYSYGREDSKGRLSKMCMWNYAGNDILGIVARSQKVAGTAQDLMGGDEVYHYHSKVCRWLNYFELIA